VKEQIPDGYATEEKLLQFNNIEIDSDERYDSALEIRLDRGRAEACQWMITLQSDNKVSRPISDGCRSLIQICIH
jgi:hypothetical protein